MKITDKMKKMKFERFKGVSLDELDLLDFWESNTNFAEAVFAQECAIRIQKDYPDTDICPYECRSVTNQDEDVFGWIDEIEDMIQAQILDDAEKYEKASKEASE